MLGPSRQPWQGQLPPCCSGTTEALTTVSQHNLADPRQLNQLENLVHKSLIRQHIMKYTWRFQYFKHSGERLPHKCQVSLYCLGASPWSTSLSSSVVQHVKFFHGVQNLYSSVSWDGLSLWYLPSIHCPLWPKLGRIHHVLNNVIIAAIKYCFSYNILVKYDIPKLIWDIWNK